ncbi:AI-2E family transporter [Paenibacillus sp. NPDC057967]|uniref:AI-2E family transporter n=1 Tax=Paenibacillus sp. NPDC057967 TaxID=3346293 RepID=UPI0036DBB69F
MSWKEKKGFKWLVVAILVLLLFYLLSLNRSWFQPIGVVLNAVFFPFAVTGVLYYLFRPLVEWLERRKTPRSVAVLLVFLVIALSLAGIVLTAGPFFQKQFASFVAQVPEMVEFVADGIESLRNEQQALAPPIRDAIPNLSQEIGSEWNRYAGSIAGSMLRVFNWMSNALFVLGLVPFILFYALKDGDKLVPKLIDLAPSSYREHVPPLLKDLDDTLSSFIRGKAVISLVVGILLLAGYSIIGLEYALVLAVIGMLANIVPFFGPVIGAAPAVLVALIQDPVMALYVVLVTVIIQQIEGNFISPQIMGKTMDIHPVTVIVLIIAAGSLTGLIGILIVVPVYAVVKVLIKHGRLILHAHKRQRIHPQ